MDLTILTIAIISVFLISVLLTGLVRRYALAYELIDEPNERSSHVRPTPRGGGLAISLAMISTILLLFWLDKIPANYAMGLGGGGALVSLAGWLDDHYDIQAIWRACAYLAASIWAVIWLGGFNTISIGVYEIELNYYGAVLAALGITWMINLYNFMDGTDGIAGSQAITASLMAGFLFWMANQKELATICFILASTSAGFLIWNWPPAKIFMGDIGSCLIGFLFGALSIIGENTKTVPIVIWFILLSLFICDATLTLIKRIYKRDRWYSAHKTHAYQKAVQLGMSHKQLAISLIFINILVLWPISYIAYKFNYLSMHLLLLVLIIMSILWVIIHLKYQRFHTKYK